MTVRSPGDARSRLEGAEETLRAIRHGEVDAFVIATPAGDRIYTLQGADRSYQVLVEAMAEGTATVTKEGLILYANRAFSRMIGIPLEKVIGASIHDFVAASHRARFQGLLNGRSRIAGREISLRTARGTVLPVSLSTSVLPKSDPKAFCLVATDLTERKKTEAELVRHRKHLEDLVSERTEALKAALADKDVLMRELSHRTKNNMQVVVGLLGLQAAEAGDGRLIEALADAQGRIRAMALVHEKLYRSGTVASLSMKEYVRDLLASLLRAHRGNGGPVRPVLELEDVALSLDAAQPLGLIINELVSNSFRHAFSEGRGGTVFLSLRRDGEEVEMRYRDDGPGLPPGLDLSRVQSLGLKLVYNLAVRQLRGTMDLGREPRPEFVLRFRDPDLMKRVLP